MDKSTAWAIALTPILGPLIGYLLFVPGRKFSRWLWKKLPDGRLRNLLLKRIGPDKDTWPPLPPAP
jgi:hypothetical protein